MEARPPIQVDAYRMAMLALLPVAMAACALQATGAQNKPSDRPSPNQEKRHVFAEGQVVDAMGRGADGALIEAWQVAPEEKSGKVTEGKPRGTPIATAKADRMGDFKLTADHEVRGEIVVLVSKKGFEPAEHRFTVGDEPWPEFIDIQLKGTLVFSGTVLDVVHAQPIPKALVTLKLVFDERETETDEQGGFSLKHLTPGRFELVVSAEGYGRETARVSIPIKDEAYSVVLKPERIVRFTVLDDERRPIQGAILECLDQPREDFRTIVTDNEGHAVLNGMHFDASELRYRLTEEAHVSSVGFDSAIDLPGGVASSSHTLIMRRAGSISGTVTAGSLGEPVSGVRLFTGSEYGDASPRDWTDFEGRYHVIGVPTGKTLVTVHAAGYAPQLIEIDVVVGQTTPLDIHLTKGNPVAGMITDSEGAPSVGALVATTTWRGATTLGLRAMTRPDGSFVIADAPDDEFGLRVVGPNGERAAATYRPGSGEALAIALPKPKDARAPDAMPLFQPGQDAPDFSATTLAGKKLDLKSLRGKVVLLDFWATWCGPCVAELPNIIETHKAFGGRADFVVIGISLDFDKKTLADFIKRRKLPWHQVQGDAASAVAESYGVSGIPALFLIDKAGKIVRGDLHGGSVKAAVEQALKDEGPS